MLFYNLCDSIGYPAFKSYGIYGVVDDSISVETKTQIEIIRVRELKNWLSTNNMYQRKFFHECLAGRKGFPEYRDGTMK